MQKSNKQIKRLFEINTVTFLKRLSLKYDQKITLANIPDEELATIVDFGFDAVWLMGVWQRSPLSAQFASQSEGLLNEARQFLPDFTPDDIISSAYSVRSYTINEQLGDEAELSILRQRLADHNLKLILDFVPNHSALDSEWLVTHPEYYVHGSPENLQQNPSWFYNGASGESIALGRDPNLNISWDDVAQLNAFSDSYRQGSAQTLQHLTKICDGVRCDMSMLMLNDVFTRTWGSLISERPTTEYWQEVIDSVRVNSPDFLFVAEAYWDLQKQLLDLGFDYCYEKSLSDYLIAKDNASVINQLSETASISNGLVRFLENHDEPRAAATLPTDQHRAALYLISSLPGMLLCYEGETVGYPYKIPVQLRRQPDAPINQEIAAFYHKILSEKHMLDWRNYPNDYRILIGLSTDHDFAAIINFSDEPITISLQTALSDDATGLSSIESPFDTDVEVEISDDHCVNLKPWQIVEMNSSTGQLELQAEAGQI